ncbi:NAD(P)-dependent dehydrogenase (short-subunit alcohol dehydrogenase family) [Bradyrhizobium sp. GM22.5]
MPRKNNAIQEDTMARFEGKVAVVTGAGAAIGKAAPSPWRARAAEWWWPTLVARRASPAPRRSRPKRATRLAVAMDIADAQSVAALLETAERHFGGVDLLVNNASDMHLTPRHCAILDPDLTVSDETMATNLRGTLLCCPQAISLAAVARSSTWGRGRGSALTPRRRPTPRRRRR